MIRPGVEPAHFSLTPLLLRVNLRYTIDGNISGKKSVCALSVPLPGNGAPWMALLKVSCLEGHELAVHPRHYGKRVVKVG